MVSKEELFQTVWAETVVSEAALTFCIRELRRALGDEAREPRYIETVHRRGFRFIAAVTTAPPTLGLEARGLGLVPPPPPDIPVSSLKPLVSSLVGREA